MDDESTQLACSCGSSWFKLHDGVVAHGRVEAAICLSKTGQVEAWSGVLVCAECGTSMGLPELQDEPAPAMRLVQ